MFALSNNIIIGKYSFDYIVNVNINTSTDQLTDTCVVTIPNKLQFEGKSIAVGSGSVFKRDDKVEINIGYDGNNNKAFTGYVKNIKSSSPVVLECENEMFLLKKTPITASYKEITLNELIKDHIPNGISYKTVDVNLGKFRISGATLAKVLDEIKKSYGLYCYFRDGKLYSGLHDYDEFRVTHKFKFGYNIINPDLTYKIKDDINLKVKCISIYDDNTRLELDLPSKDADGEQRTLYFYNKTESELKTLGTIELEKLKYDGYSGKFEAFGEPFVKKGDAVQLIDDDYKEREGTYLVKSVEYKFGINGYRQIIEIEKKLTNPQ